MHSSPLDESSALSPLLLPSSSSSPCLPEFGPYLHSSHSSGSMTVDSSASSGLLMSISASAVPFAHHPFTPSAGHPSISQSQQQQQRQYQQQQQQQAPSSSSSMPLSSPQLIVARLLELERSLQYLTTAAYCHPILATGLSSQFYVIKYAMHALSAEEKKLTAWQQRRQQRAMERRQRARVKRETIVKSEEDDAGLSMRGEGETDPSVSVSVMGGLLSHDPDEAADEQQQEDDEERRQSEMHELRANKAELRHVGEWINAQLAALHSQVQAQLAHYPSPPASPPPPPPPPTAAGGSANPHPSTQQHRSAFGPSSSGTSHFGAGSTSSSSFHQSITQYPTASTTATGSAYPTYSAPAAYSFPPPPLDERSVSTGSRSSLSSPVTPPPISQPPPLFSSQSLPVWSSGAGNLSPLNHSSVYRKIDRHDFLDTAYMGSSDVMDTSAALNTTHFAPLSVSSAYSSSHHSARYPPHPASSQSLGVASFPSTAIRSTTSTLYPAYAMHTQHSTAAYTTEGSRRGRHRPHSHSDEFGPTDWQAEQRRLQQQQLQQHEQAGQQAALLQQRAYSTSGPSTEEREGDEAGRQRKRGGSRRRKREKDDYIAAVYAFPRPPQSIFPKLPSAADNPHELPSSQRQHRQA